MRRRGSIRISTLVVPWAHVAENIVAPAEVLAAAAISDGVAIGFFVTAALALEDLAFPPGPHAGHGGVAPGSSSQKEEMR